MWIYFISHFLLPFSLMMRMQSALPAADACWTDYSMLISITKQLQVFAWDSEHALGCASTRDGCRSVCTVWLNRGPTNLGAAHSENNFYLREGGYFFVVCLLATLCENFQTKRICMKFLGKVGSGPMNKWLNFGGDHRQGLFSRFVTIGRKWYQPTALRDVAVHGMH